MLSLFAAVIFGAVPSLGRGVKVIANPSLRADSITVAQLKSIYMQEQRSINGSHIELVLAKGGPAHEVFLKQYIGKSDDALRTYYRTLVFTGTGLMPKVLASDGDVLHYVANTRGGIGYVSPDFPADGVKVLTILEPGVSAERQLVTRVEPDYPETLQRLRIGGIVRLELTISHGGSVENVSVLGGNPILAEAAAKAVKQWVYAPGPSQSRTQVIVPFEPRP
jgi:TonB family protein